MRTTGHFPSHYSINTDVELPPRGGQTINFKYGNPAPVTSGIDGPLMQIEPSTGSPWLACFANGYKGTGVVSAVLATPNPDVVCVVCDGAGYWVDTLRRTKEDVRAFPIRQVEPMGGMLVFAGFTKLAAYGPSGMAWVSETRVSDGLVLEERPASDNILTCYGFSASTGGQVEVKVDACTGRVVRRPDQP